MTTMTDADTLLLLKATRFAAHKHRDQRRKDVLASPYINHPVMVTSILAEEAHILDINVLCGGLLHDTIEDTDTSSEELLYEFGADIQRIVLEVTDDNRLPKVDRKRLQIEQAASASYEGRLVKLADKIANLRDMVNAPPAQWPTKRIREYYDWATAVIDQIRGTNPTLERLFDDACRHRP